MAPFPNFKKVLVVFDWMKGLPVHQRYHEAIEKFMTVEVNYKFEFYLEDETSTEVVQTVIDCTKDLTELVGPLFLESWHANLTRCLKKLLEGTAPCLDFTQNEDQVSLWVRNRKPMWKFLKPLLIFCLYSRKCSKMIFLTILRPCIPAYSAIPLKIKI